MCGFRLSIDSGLRFLQTRCASIDRRMVAISSRHALHAPIVPAREVILRRLSIADQSRTEYAARTVTHTAFYAVRDGSVDSVRVQRALFQSFAGVSG
jgi:hypothetical protein